MKYKSGCREIRWTVHALSAPSRKLDTPLLLKDYCIEAFPEDGREYVIVITFNTQLRPIEHYIVSVGTEMTSLVRPVEVFGQLMRSGLSTFALIHNHPSGDATPSREDREVYDRIKKAADIMSLRMIDYAILGSGTHAWHSFAEKAST